MQKKQTPLKGQKYFIEAAQLAARNDVDYLIVGAPNTEPDKKYQQQFLHDYNSFMAQGNLRFVGAIPDIAAKLAAFDIIVMPSINEGFSLVVIEAMAAGVAVIASQVGGMIDLIEDHKTGVFIEPGSSVQIAEAMNKLLNNEELRQRLGTEASQMALKNYSRDTVIDEIEKLYRPGSARGSRATSETPW